MGIVGRVVAPCFPVGRRLFGLFAFGCVWAVRFYSVCDRKSEENDPSETVNGIAPKERRLLELLRENPAITYRQAAIALGVPYTTVWRTFRAMQEAKLIERTGSDRRGTWRILTPPQISHE